MPAMPAPDLDKIGFLTRRFNQLQGLRYMVPYGLYLIAGGVVALMGKHLWVGLALWLTLFAIAILLLRRARMYYEARVGVVEQDSGFYLGLHSATPHGEGTLTQDATLNSNRYSLFMLLGLPCAAAALALAGFTRSLPDMARGAYLLIGIASFGTWWISREHRVDQAHYAVFGAIACALAVRGDVWGVLPPTSASFQMMRVFVGTELVVCGLIDHWQLMHNLGASGATDANGADA
jgi:hypothetical protein